MTVRVAAVALVALLWVGGEARASCGPTSPVDQFRAAQAAFVGQLAQREGDQLTFAVEEALKGSLSDRVTVRDESR